MDRGLIPGKVQGLFSKNPLEGVSLFPGRRSSNGRHRARWGKGWPAASRTQAPVRWRHGRRRVLRRRQWVSPFRAPNREARPWARGGGEGELTPGFGSAWEGAESSVRGVEATRSWRDPERNELRRLGLDFHGAIGKTGYGRGSRPL